VRQSDLVRTPCTILRTMRTSLTDLDSFLAVAEARGFRDAARSSGASASGLSEAVRRLEARLGVRLLHRTTRSVTPTEAGQRLIERLRPALAEVDSALDILNSFRDRPAGTLRLNVPIVAARLVLPLLLPDFLTAYPDIRVEITATDNFVDALASGSDAGIRYEERLERNMIAIPIGPRTQRIAAAAAPSYLAARGRPRHPRDLLKHACLRLRFDSGVMVPWEFERDGVVIQVDPEGPLIVNVGGAADLAVEMAVAGLGIVSLFEEWLRPHLCSGALEPVMEPWWQSFSGPFLYYSGRSLVPAPLRAFIDFVKAAGKARR
jgi:DNA-binding transcriptional LysR family regulator